MSSCQHNIDPDQLLAVMEEVETQIRQSDISQKDKVSLYLQLSLLYGLMGDKDQQESAWLQAQKLSSGIKLLEDRA